MNAVLKANQSAMERTVWSLRAEAIWSDNVAVQSPGESATTLRSNAEEMRRAADIIERSLAE